jgi:hypothetical protein
LISGAGDLQISESLIHTKLPIFGSEEIDQALDSLAEGSDDRALLQPEAYTRESIYQDHN